MGTVRGTVIDGKVVLDPPASLPDGTRVRVEAEDSEYVGVGMREEDWPTTPEGIAALIAKMDQIEPFLSPEEEAAWKEQRAKDKAAQLAMWDKWTKEVGDLFR